MKGFMRYVMLGLAFLLWGLCTIGLFAVAIIQWGNQGYDGAWPWWGIVFCLILATISAATESVIVADLD